jgi:hypothetical protein
VAGNAAKGGSMQTQMTPSLNPLGPRAARFPLGA